MPEQLHLLGLSHRTAPVEIREKAAIPAAALPGFLAWLRSAGATEAVAVSTCNRVEVYWTGDTPETGAALRARWEAAAGQLEGRLYSYEGATAANHLFHVAGGMDSMVLGETQVLGQVKAAYQAALELGATGRTLNRLFQKAMAAGKIVRTRTAVASGITSVAGAAVVLAEKIFGDLSSRVVLILGAGKMAEAAGKRLVFKKVGDLFVANRTFARAEELARALRAEPLSWDDGLARLPDADIVLCSTSAEQFVLTAELVGAVMRRRAGRPLFLIDIAVPRGIDPSVEKLEGVFLYDIDNLNEIVERRTARAKLEAEKAEALLREEFRKFQAAGRPPAPVPPEPAPLGELTFERA